jgi:hypothetical protein
MGKSQAPASDCITEANQEAAKLELAMAACRSVKSLVERSTC